MSEKKYQSLKEFYRVLTSSLNFMCIGLVFVSFITFWLTFNWYYLIAIPFLGYGFAWVGHFFFEKNKPATFQYPGYSLASDFIMFWDLLRGKESFSPS